MSVDRRCFYLKTDSGHVGPRHQIVRWGGLVHRFPLLPDPTGPMIETIVADVARGTGVKTVGMVHVSSSRNDSTQWHHIMSEAPGVSVAEVTNPSDRASIYRSLARQLKTLHSIPALGAGYIVEGAPLRGAFDTWREYLMSHFDTQAMYAIKQGLLSDEDAIMIGYHCGAVHWDGEPRLLHGDLSDRNLFAANGEITAILDWEDALAGPIEHDLAYWATHHERHEWDALFDAYPYSPDRTFWAYYLRIALSKLVLNHKHGVPDLTRSLERIQLGLKELA